jgi:hypothetical protein
MSWRNFPFLAFFWSLQASGINQLMELFWPRAACNINYTGMPHYPPDIMNRK